MYVRGHRRCVPLKWDWNIFSPRKIKYCYVIFFENFHSSTRFLKNFQAEERFWKVALSVTVHVHDLTMESRSYENQLIRVDRVWDRGKF